MKRFTHIEATRSGERVRGRLAANTNETVVVGGDSRGERGRLAANTNETVVRPGMDAARRGARLGG